ncbi:unnamed protein product [Fusarium graminearum]|uniref:Uncharacterized protein n=1 Tax=Gibberella zeae (strain ATCC MYA-4620 / CBS 123657 / FGSC 9075 / NRRL 31084 / PH-1) TaxID=229533 RepID=A0A098DR55_GIBZE|nr:unnamed protein product [Fusarium graminearum]
MHLTRAQGTSVFSGGGCSRGIAPAPIVVDGQDGCRDIITSIRRKSMVDAWRKAIGYLANNVLRAETLGPYEVRNAADDELSSLYRNFMAKQGSKYCSLQCRCNLAPGFWFWGRADPHLVPGEHLSLDVVESKCERKVASTRSNPFKTCAACTDATLWPCRNAIKRLVWALSPTPLVSRPAGLTDYYCSGPAHARLKSVHGLGLAAGEFLMLTEHVALIIHGTLLQCYRILQVRSRKCTMKQMCLDLRTVGLSSRYHVNVPSLWHKDGKFVIEQLIFGSWFVSGCCKTISIPKGTTDRKSRAKTTPTASLTPKPGKMWTLVFETAGGGTHRQPSWTTLKPNTSRGSQSTQLSELMTLWVFNCRDLLARCNVCAYDAFEEPVTSVRLSRPITGQVYETFWQYPGHYLPWLYYRNCLNPETPLVRNGAICHPLNVALKPTDAMGCQILKIAVAVWDGYIDWLATGQGTWRRAATVGMASGRRELGSLVEAAFNIVHSSHCRGWLDMPDFSTDGRSANRQER